jgi:iron complex outermembrane receptor protein
MIAAASAAADSTHVRNCWLGIVGRQCRTAGLLIGAIGTVSPFELARAADPANVLPKVSVTAARVEEPNDQVPAFITIIDGAELLTRGVADLRGVVALVAGVEASPGGDTGPAGAVTSFWGLHEFDAFLLVVDGVPWGGAFNPAIPTLNLNNVERIEIMRGAAPVTYGATSFVGVIQVIHYAAESTPSTGNASVGSHGSVRGAFSSALQPIGIVSHSISIDAQRLKFSDPRESIESGRVLYRASAPVADGTLRLDIDIISQRQVPPSPIVRVGGALTTLTPLDQNYNPSDAEIKETRYQAVIRYSHPLSNATWQSTASVAYSDITDIRGFLRPTLENDGSANADSQRISMPGLSASTPRYPKSTMACLGLCPTSCSKLVVCSSCAARM